VAQGLLVGNQLPLEQRHKGLVKGLHVVGGVPLGDGLMNVHGLLLVHDAVPDACGGDHDLYRGNPPHAVGPGQEPLRDHPFEDTGQLEPDLFLLIRGVDGDDPVYRLRGIQGVKRAEDEVPGLGRQDGRFNSHKIPHLPHEDHVRVLAQGHLEGLGKVIGIRPDLSLADDPLVVAMEELDGVLDGDDVTASGTVDLVDHGRQGGRFAAAGGTGQEDQPPPFIGDPLQYLHREVEFLEPLDPEGDHPEGDGNGPPLLKDVDPKPPQP